MKKLAISILLSVYCIGAVPDKNAPATPPNYSMHFPGEEEQASDKGLVGEDDLKQDKIQYGIGYESKVGKSPYQKLTDESGNVYYKNIETGEDVTNFKEQKVSEQYKNSTKNIPFEQPLEDEEIRKKNEDIAKAKEERKKELSDKGYTPKQYENLFLHNLDAPGEGSSYLNSSFLKPLTKEELEAQEKDEYINGGKEREFYRDNFSFSQSNNTAEKSKPGEKGIFTQTKKSPRSGLVDEISKDDIYKSEGGDAKLVDAYSFVADYKAKLSAKNSDNSIKCFISRELVPSYYCPILGKQNTLYGGDELTESGTAIKNCNDNCREVKECASYDISNELKNGKLIEFTKEEMTVFPWVENEKNINKSEKISELMSVDRMKFKIEVTKSDKFKGTDEEFRQFLKSTDIKFKMDLIKQEETVNNPPQALISGEVINIKDTLIEKEIFIANTTEFLTLKFYKPFISPNTLTEALLNKDKWEKIGSIKIKEINAEYLDSKLFFCPFRQMVNSETECNLNEGGKIIKLKSGSQVYNICTDASHKIGPDRIYGGFYTNTSCQASCVETSDCFPTYRNKSFDDKTSFKAQVGCVASEDNSACTKQKCEDLLGENELKPTNEWVTWNDDTKVQTISNNVLNTSVMRPKFNLGDEMTVSTSYTEVFQAEMKDAAYKYMIDNTTFNRVMYRIGEESPRKMSYFIDTVDYHTRLFWNLKPASFDIDNNQEYNLYVVMELDQMYKPVAGMFLIDGNYVKADGNDIQFIDKTYLIKTAQKDDNWKVFKKIEFHNIKQIYSILRCNDGKYEQKPRYYYAQKEIPEGCIVYEEEVWPTTPHLNINRNAFYDTLTDTFGSYDLNTKASVFIKQKFSSDIPINKYQLSDALQAEIELAPGAIIRNQESLNHDKDFKKIYNTNSVDSLKKGWVSNYRIYAFYSKNQLSYAELMDEVKEDNVIYDKINNSKLPRTIKHDGEINNNVKPFVLGNKEVTTIDLESIPFLHEEGQRVFKFLFLYDDESEGKSPFEKYKIIGK